MVEEVIHPVEEVILLLRFYCHPQSQLGMGIRGLGLGLDNIYRGGFGFDNRNTLNQELTSPDGLSALSILENFDF